MGDPRDLASAMRELRGGRDQKQLAQRAGINPTTWSSYERGEHYPRTAERLKEIAYGLGCTYDRLEEVMWKARNERLAFEEAKRQVSAQMNPAIEDPQAIADPRRRAIRERLATMLPHVEELLLLVADLKDSKP